MRVLLRVSALTDRVLGWIAEASGWLFVVLMAVICFDVASRKMGFQIPGFGSTRLQEMEWHLHTVIFSMWLGFNYLINGHPRVDSFTEMLPIRRKAAMELAGLLVFAIPYIYVLVYFGIDFVVASYVGGEGSDAPTGLPHRWIIKSLFFAGLVLLMAALVSMALRLIVFLFGPPQLREQAKPPLSDPAISI